MSDVLNNDVLEAVRMIAGDLFEMEPAQIGEDFSPEKDARWDSLKHLGLVTAIEDQYDVAFEPEEIEQMTDIAAIVRVTQACLKR